MASTSEFRLVALLRRLAAAHVDFVVIGGVAVAVQGYGRSTQDLDITYATDAENLERLGGVLLSLNARLRGVADDVPFIPDARTLRRVQLLTLRRTTARWTCSSTPPARRRTRSCGRGRIASSSRGSRSAWSRSTTSSR